MVHLDYDDDGNALERLAVFVALIEIIECLGHVGCPGFMVHEQLELGDLVFDSLFEVKVLLHAHVIIEHINLATPACLPRGYAAVIRPTST